MSDRVVNKSREDIKKNDDHGHDHSNIRVKDATVNVKDLDKNVQDFYFELSSGLQAYYPDGGYELLVTSGKRQPSDRIGKKSNTSKHNTGEAIDLRANEKVYNYLNNTKEGLGIMVNHGIGLLDETTTSALKKTDGTAAHLHLGYDSNNVTATKQRFSSESLTHIPMGGSGVTVIPAKASGSDNGSAFVVKDGGTGYVVTDAVEAPFNYLEEDFLNDVNKTKNTSEKIEKSEERQKLEELKREEKKQQHFLKALQENVAVHKPAKDQRQNAYNEQSFEPIDIQQKLPDLPSIFKTLP